MSTPPSIAFLGNDHYGYDVAEDGRFILNEQIPSPSPAPQLVLVQNWFQELERLAPNR
jgi:hypothetical protein